MFAKINSDEQVESPGMKYKHYAPEAKCKLVACLNELDQTFNINKLIKGTNGKVIVIGFTEHEEKIHLTNGQFLPIADKNDLEEYGRNIFTAIRYADSLKPDLIIIEGVKKLGFGIAIMNRLLRTCEYDVIE